MVPVTQKNTPKHVVVIPDGNRRWAKEKGLPAFMGHKKGAEVLEPTLRAAKKLGIKYYTTWVFSTENWKREKDEVEALFDLFRDLAKRNKKKFLKEGIRFIHLGRKDRLPKDLAELLKDLEESTKHLTDFTFSLGIDYGGHDEIIRACNNLVEEGLEINKENIESHLDTWEMPMPDLIIRTSGEQRLSGFMSWQCAYAEFYFTERHYPDFGPKELEKAIEDFMGRNRRFGGNSKSKKS
jgi:undecaprenyl diphosphate synthase